MKKLITIALLTLSTFSLMAQFPVTRDNFNSIAYDGKWCESNVSCDKFQISHTILGVASRVQNTPIVSFSDKKLHCDITVFENEGESWAVVDKRNAEKEVFYSSSTLFSDINGKKTYVFSFDEAGSIDILVFRMDGHWILGWRLWE